MDTAPITEKTNKRSARERLREEKAAEQARAKRKKTLIVGGVVVAVIAAAVVVGVAVQSKRSKPETPTAAPRGTLGDKGLEIPSGVATAPSVLTVYEDPRCPACGAFEKTFSATVNQLQDQGKLVVHYHLVSFIDRSLGGKGSKYGANALACAQDAGRFRDYHDVLYRNQPDETSDAFGDKAALIKLGKQVNGLDSPAFESCVENGRFAGWVSAVQQNFDKSSFRSTPTLLLNGTSIFPKKGDEQITPENLVKWVDEANKGKVSAPASAAPSAASGAAPSTSSSAAPGASSSSAPSTAPSSPAGASPSR